MNLGSGRVVPQGVTIIDAAIADGEFASDETLRRAFEHAKRSGGRLHLMGLLSDGCVHSSIAHLFALIDAAVAADVPDCRSRFLDGRDTPPRSALRLRRAARSEARARAARRLDRERHRPILRDGPRPALGAHPARLRLARQRTRRPSSERCGKRDPRRLRARRRRRVRRADDRRGAAPDRRRRRLRLLQFSTRSRAPAHDGLQRRHDDLFRRRVQRLHVEDVSQSVLRHDDEVRRNVHEPGALRSAAAARYVRRDSRARRSAAASARRDREVRARHLLLQRRPRRPVRRRGSHLDSLGSLGADLRSRSGDARARDHRRGRAKRLRTRRTTRS